LIIFNNENVKEYQSVEILYEARVESTYFNISGVTSLFTTLINKYLNVELRFALNYSLMILLLHPQYHLNLKLK
jgi:hypothetical protein